MRHEGGLTDWTELQHWIDPVLQEPPPPPPPRATTAGVAAARTGRARVAKAARRANMLDGLREKVRLEMLS